MINNKEQQDALIARIKRESELHFERVRKRQESVNRIEEIRSVSNKTRKKIESKLESLGIPYKKQSKYDNTLKRSVIMTHNGKDKVILNVVTKRSREVGKSWKGVVGFDESVALYYDVIKRKRKGRPKTGQALGVDYRLFKKCAVGKSYYNSKGVLMLQRLKIMDLYFKETGHYMTRHEYSFHSNAYKKEIRGEKNGCNRNITKSG